MLFCIITFRDYDGILRSSLTHFIKNIKYKENFNLDYRCRVSSKVESILFCIITFRDYDGILRSSLTHFIKNGLKLNEHNTRG